MLTYNELQQLELDVESILCEMTPLKDRINELEIEAGMPGFWDDIDFATKKTKELGELKAQFARLQSIQDAKDYQLLVEDEVNSSSYIDNNDLENALDELHHLVSAYKKEKMLSGKYDNLDAIITVHAGSGGTESCDFTDMVFRMIARWADNRGFAVKLTDEQKDDVAGLKSATMILSGTHAYGYAKALNGIFRLVRISPFDAANRRHTSFMAVEVVPRIEHDDSIEVRIEDCDIATFRSGGKGGQYQNKTDSGVRLTHKPSGLIVECREERSQLQNKNRCLEKLRCLLATQQQNKIEKEMFEITGEKDENGWGNSSISITLMPYQLVKDNRTNWSTSQPDKFFNGELDDMINSYLEYINGKI